MVTAQGKTEVHGHVADRAGNEVIAVATVLLDSSRPTITAKVSPPDWSNAASGTVTFTCTAGSAPLAGTCPAPVTVTSPGDTPVTRSITDTLGRTASVTAHVRLDRTPPTITAQVAPTPNAAGWNRDATVTVTFTCGDADSGIPDGACPADRTFDTDGVFQVHGSVSDAAGNGATVDVTVYRDRTKPTIATVVRPAPNPAGWNNTDASGAFVCSDALSGIPSGACPASVPVTVEGSQTVSGSVTDTAGNTSPTASVTVKLDKTAPTVAAAGAAGTVKTCSTTDALSGVAVPATGSNVTVRV